MKHNEKVLTAIAGAPLTSSMLRNMCEQLEITQQMLDAYERGANRNHGQNRGAIRHDRLAATARKRISLELEADTIDKMRIIAIKQGIPVLHIIRGLMENAIAEYEHDHGMIIIPRVHELQSKKR